MVSKFVTSRPIETSPSVNSKTVPFNGPARKVKFGFTSVSLFVVACLKLSELIVSYINPDTIELTLKPKGSCARLWSLNVISHATKSLIALLAIVIPEVTSLA